MTAVNRVNRMIFFIGDRENENLTIVIINIVNKQAGCQVGANILLINHSYKFPGYFIQTVKFKYFHSKFM